MKKVLFGVLISTLLSSSASAGIFQSEKMEILTDKDKAGTLVCVDANGKPLGLPKIKTAGGAIIGKNSAEFLHKKVNPDASYEAKEIYTQPLHSGDKCYFE